MALYQIQDQGFDWNKLLQAAASTGKSLSDMYDSDTRRRQFEYIAKKDGIEGDKYTGKSIEDLKNAGVEKRIADLEGQKSLVENPLAAAEGEALGASNFQKFLAPELQKRGLDPANFQAVNQYATQAGSNLATEEHNQKLGMTPEQQKARQDAQESQLANIDKQIEKTRENPEAYYPTQTEMVTAIKDRLANGARFPGKDFNEATAIVWDDTLSKIQNAVKKGDTKGAMAAAVDWFHTQNRLDIAVHPDHKQAKRGMNDLLMLIQPSGGRRGPTGPGTPKGKTWRIWDKSGQFPFEVTAPTIEKAKELYNQYWNGVAEAHTGSPVSSANYQSSQRVDENGNMLGDRNTSYTSRGDYYNTLNNIVSNPSLHNPFVSRWGKNSKPTKMAMNDENRKKKLQDWAGNIN